MSETASNPRVALNEPRTAEVPPELWLRSGRPFMGTATRVYIALALIAGALIFVQRGPLFWGLVGGGVLAYFLFPLVIQGLLAPLERRVLAVRRRDVTALLQEVRARRLVRQFAPHAWLTLQEGRLHLRRGDGKAAARSFTETVRLSRGTDAPGLVSAQAQALLLADQPEQTRELLQQLSKKHPLTATDHLHLGLALVAGKGNGAEALEHMRAAEAGLGPHPRVLAGLALALHRADEPLPALMALQQAQEALGAEPDPYDEGLVQRGTKLLRTVQKAQQKRERKPVEAHAKAAVEATPRVAISVASPTQDGKAKSTRKVKKDERRSARRAAKAEKRGGAEPVPSKKVSKGATKPVEKVRVARVEPVAKVVAKSEVVVADTAIADTVIAAKLAADTAIADTAIAAKLVADKAVADKAAEAKLAADKVIADKAAEARLAADKAIADKAIADKAAEAKLAVDKAIADKVIADKAAEAKLAADKAIAEKLVADRAIAEKPVEAEAVRAPVVSPEAVRLPAPPTGAALFGSLVPGAPRPGPVLPSGPGAGPGRAPMAASAAPMAAPRAPSVGPALPPRPPVVMSSSAAPWAGGTAVPTMPRVSAPVAAPGLPRRPESVPVPRAPGAVVLPSGPVAMMPPPAAPNLSQALPETDDGWDDMLDALEADSPLAPR